MHCYYLRNLDSSTLAAAINMLNINYTFANYRVSALGILLASAEAISGDRYAYV